MQDEKLLSVGNLRALARKVQGGGATAAEIDMLAQSTWDILPGLSNMSLGAVTRAVESLSREFPVERNQVFCAIDGERDYQLAKWGPEKPEHRGVHAYLNFMQVHLDRAREAITIHADPVGTEMALHQVRKVTALGVACMEMNGALTREDEQASDQRHIDALRAEMTSASGGVMPA